MVLKELFQQANFQAVYKILEEKYEDIDSYKMGKIEKGFKELQWIEEKKEPSDDLVIYIDVSKDEDGNDAYDTFGYSECEDVTYSLVFMPCEEWLALTVDESLMDKMTISEIVAHCFWEMTWSGGWTIEERMFNAELNREVEVIKEKVECLDQNSKNTKIMLNDKLLNEIVDLYKKAKNNINIQTDVECIVEELLNKNVVELWQIEVIKNNFDDEDILDAILKI